MRAPKDVDRTPKTVTYILFFNRHNNTRADVLTKQAAAAMESAMRETSTKVLAFFIITSIPKRFTRDIPIPPLFPRAMSRYYRKQYYRQHRKRHNWRHNERYWRYWHEWKCQWCNRRRPERQFTRDIPIPPLFPRAMSQVPCLHGYLANAARYLTSKYHIVHFTPFLRCFCLNYVETSH